MIHIMKKVTKTKVLKEYSVDKIKQASKVYWGIKEIDKLSTQMINKRINKMNWNKC